jgi:hypothetical protein
MSIIDSGTKPHNPLTAATELAAKLSARTRRVCLLLGAGSSCAAGMPDVVGLLDRIKGRLKDDVLDNAERLYKDRNLEEGLTRLRKIRALLGEDETFDGFGAASAAELEKQILTGIIAELSAPPATLDPARTLALWAAGEFYSRSIEIFTTNYDLLIEGGLEDLGISYFDGFVGAMHARFRPDLIEPAAGGESLPASFVRLWKLHGSLNWKLEPSGEVRRCGTPLPQPEVAAVYPSEEKYNQSRRVPFVVLHDRFRRALAEPESLTLVCGYSFGDAHLNEVLFDAARRYPRSEIVALCYGEIPAELAGTILPNLSVMAAREAILGGHRKTWEKPEEDHVDIWEDGDFRLGDFSALAKFLARNRRSDRALPVDVALDAIDGQSVGKSTAGE